jgi:hypothetical protein
VGCGELRSARYRAEQPHPLLTGSRTACDGAEAHPPTIAEFEAIARANAAFIESCVEATGELMTHLSAMDTATDIERIRQALSPSDGLVAYGAPHGHSTPTGRMDDSGATSKQIEMVKSFAHQAAIALQNTGSDRQEDGFPLDRATRNFSACDRRCMCRANHSALNRLDGSFIRARLVAGMTIFPHVGGFAAE